MLQFRRFFIPNILQDIFFPLKEDSNPIGMVTSSIMYIIMNSVMSQYEKKLSG